MLEPLSIFSSAATVLVLGAAAYGAVAFYGLFQRLRASQKQAEFREAILKTELSNILVQYKFKHDVAQLSWNGFRKFSLDKKVAETKDISSFYLKPHDNQPLPPFKPGQYLIFNLRIPGQAKAVVRCYSLSDSPDQHNYYRVSIKRLGPPPNNPEASPGLSSNFFHDLQEGDILDVKAPSGHFYLDTEDNTPIVLIGGGIGVTPVLSMLNACCTLNPNREVWFFYGLRHGEEHILKKHFQKITQSHPNFHVHICYSEPLPDDKLGVDFDHAERVSVDLFKKLLPSSNYQYYICGPGPMMNSLTEGLMAWGVPEDHIHFEAFGPASVSKVAKKEGAEQAPASVIEVKFTRSNKVIQSTNREQTLLELAEANGLNLDFGCRAGSCGTCLVALKAGDVAYPFVPESPIEKGSCLACIARVKEPIEVDA